MIAAVYCFYRSGTPGLLSLCQIPTEAPAASSRPNSRKNTSARPKPNSNASPTRCRTWPEDVKEVILETQNIKDHEGRRRALQFVGKKMRSLDEEEIAVIRRTIEGWKGASKADTAALHALERRRDKLLADDNALTALLSEHPDLDVQHLRALIRNARKEQAENKPPKAYREIFQILKDLAAQSAKAAAADEEGDEEVEDDDE
jgi:ribosome-associated protein